ncbi:DUF2441 domain-containing protein [Devosia alba]|uniref:DUF2441 domain-containing protein n=1 Tax=Devosia alba TaxID=3152360 RepID=UPI0032671A5C
MYFHVAPLMLAPGSVIEAGNWGRMLSLYHPWFGQPAIALRERIFEEVRVASFPEKPSRLQCCYVLPDRDTALEYWRGQPQSLIYRVEPVLESAPTHFGCWSFGYINGEVSTPKFMDELPTLALDYWASSRIINPEILLTSAIRIIDRIPLTREMVRAAHRWN